MTIVEKIRWSNYTLKLFFFKDNLIVVLKSLFTRIYWCFVINYRFKIVQIVTLGPMNWPLDQYLTFGPMAWPSNQRRDPRNNDPLFRRTVELWERRRFQRYALDFNRENLVKNYNAAACDTVTQTSWCIVESCLSYSWFSLCWTCRNQRSGANSLLLQNTLKFTN